MRTRGYDFTEHAQCIPHLDAGAARWWHPCVTRTAPYRTRWRCHVHLSVATGKHRREYHHSLGVTVSQNLDASRSLSFPHPGRDPGRPEPEGGTSEQEQPIPVPTTK